MRKQELIPYKTQYFETPFDAFNQDLATQQALGSGRGSIKQEVGDFSSANFKPGVSGWRWRPNGDIEANDGIFRGQLKTDILFFTKDTHLLSLESLDGWDVSVGGISLNVGQIFIQTSSTINTIKRALSLAGSYPEWDKNFVVQFSVQVSAITAQDIYMVSGSIDENAPEDQAVGFKIVDGVLYAFSSDSDGASTTEHTTAITGVTLTALTVYRVEFTKRSAQYSGGRCDFFVNDVLKATYLTNLPDPDYTGGGMFDFYIKNTAAANKTLSIKGLYWSQDLT